MWYNFKQLHKLIVNRSSVFKRHFYKNIKQINGAMTLHLTGSSYHTVHSASLCLSTVTDLVRARISQAVQRKKSWPTVLRVTHIWSFFLAEEYQQFNNFTNLIQVVPCPLGISTTAELSSTGECRTCHVLD